jgi:hypothetical protein
MSNHDQPTSSAAEIFGSNRMWGLKELPLPEPVSWWPQTTGWYYLAVLILIVFVWTIWRLWRNYQRNAYRRNGLKQLDGFWVDPNGLTELPFLLRRSALQAAPRSRVAGLRGADWIDWLNESAGQNLFNESDADLLDTLAYAGQQDFDFNTNSTRHLMKASRIWMGSHRVTV